MICRTPFKEYWNQVRGGVCKNKCMPDLQPCRWGLVQIICCLGERSRFFLPVNGTRKAYPLSWYVLS